MTTPEGEAAKAKAEAVFKKQVLGGIDEGRQVQDKAMQVAAEKISHLRALRLVKQESDRTAAEIRRARREKGRP